MRDPGFAISIVYPIMKSLEQKGYNFVQFCQSIGFDNRILEDVEARVDSEDLETLMIEAAKYTDDEHFGLHQGALTDIADLGILGYVMMHSSKVIDALEAYKRYNIILCSGYNVDWSRQGNHVHLRMYSVGSPRISRHCMEDMASSLYRLLQRFTNRRIPLEAVTFMHNAPSDVAPYLEVFGMVPEFGSAANVFVLDGAVLDYPNLYADDRLLRTFEPLAEQIRERLLNGKEYTDQVFQWMMRRMPIALPSLQDTAKQFQLSARTLQTKLQEEGASFHDLTARVRKEWALTYLRRNEYSISEIAYLLHYSEPSAFHSAFKKWTGMTPGQFRASDLQHYGVVSP